MVPKNRGRRRDVAMVEYPIPAASFPNMFFLISHHQHRSLRVLIVCCNSLEMSCTEPSLLNLCRLQSRRQAASLTRQHLSECNTMPLVPACHLRTQILWTTRSSRSNYWRSKPLSTPKSKRLSSDLFTSTPHRLFIHFAHRPFYLELRSDQERRRLYSRAVPSGTTPTARKHRSQQRAISRPSSSYAKGFTNFSSTNSSRPENADMDIDGELASGRAYLYDIPGGRGSPSYMKYELMYTRWNTDLPEPILLNQP